VKVVVMIDSEAIAAPRPWTARAAISYPSDREGRRRASVHAHTADHLTARLDGEIVGNLSRTRSHR
jgi:hypothetical protein